MKLSYIFDALATGELSNLNLAEGMDKIKPEKLPSIVKSINAGLIDLYTRFLLSRKSIQISVMNGQKVYVIDDPDLLEIIDVYYNHDKLIQNSLEGYRILSINSFELKNRSHCYGNFIDSPFTHVPHIPHPAVITVEYKAKHRELTEQDIALDSEVNLPISYLNALLYFIGSRLLLSIPNQMDGDLNESARIANKYTAEINMLITQGIDVDELQDNNVFYNRGFR